MKEQNIPAQKKTLTAGSIAASAKKLVTSKKFIILMVQCLVMTAFIFAGEDDDDVSATIINKLQLVINILYSGWVKALFGAVVGFKAVSFIINHEQGTFKKLLPLAGAALIYFIAPTIANKLMTTQGYTINETDGTMIKK